MDGTEDGILYEDLMAPSTALANPIDSQDDVRDETNDDDELNDYYDYGVDDLVSDEQMRHLFESDDESQEFEGFESD